MANKFHPDDADPADLPAKGRGSRSIIKANCRSCSTPLPTIPTDKGGVWLWAYCTKCGEFNSVPDALSHGGQLIGDI